MMYLSSTGKNPITGEVTSYKTAVIKVIEVIDLTVLQVIKRHIPGRAVNGLSFAFFRAALALLVHELERLKLRIVEMVENREHFEFDDLW